VLDDSRCVKRGVITMVHRPASRRLGTIVGELILVLSAFVSLSIFVAMAVNTLVRDGSFEARSIFTYRSLLLESAAFMLFLVALVVEIIGRCRSQSYYEGRLYLCVLSALSAVTALGSILAAREYDRLRSWDCVYRYQFVAVGYLEYLWSVGDRRDLDFSGSSTICFATQRTRDSGAYDLWRARMSPAMYASFLRNNAALKRYLLPDVAARPISAGQMPKQWAVVPDIEWWTPPQSLLGCQCYQWSDQFGTAVAWSVYDNRNETLWFRRG
jgi:hypothetical protein